MDFVVDDLCAGKTGYHEYPGDCRRFILCANGLTHVYECAAGLFWSVAATSCDWEANVDCG